MAAAIVMGMHPTRKTLYVMRMSMTVPGLLPRRGTILSERNANGRDHTRTGGERRGSATSWSITRLCRRNSSARLYGERQAAIATPG
jgi:hypothetical protein